MVRLFFFFFVFQTYKQQIIKDDTNIGIRDKYVRGKFVFGDHLSRSQPIDTENEEGATIKEKHDANHVVAFPEVIELVDNSRANIVPFHRSDQPVESYIIAYAKECCNQS